MVAKTKPMTRGERKTEVKISLEYPLPGVNGGEPVTELTIGRLKAKHLRALPESMTNAEEGDEVKLTPVEMIPMIAAITNITDEQAGELDLEDLTTVAETVTDFFEQYREAGKS
jgi:hypothetical protein